KVGSIAQLKASVKPTMSCLAAAGKVAFKAAAEAGVRELLDEALRAFAETADHAVASLRQLADALQHQGAEGGGKVEELVASLAGQAGRKAFEAGKKKFLAEVTPNGGIAIFKVGSIAQLKASARPTMSCLVAAGKVAFKAAAEAGVRELL